MWLVSWWRAVQGCHGYLPGHSAPLGDSLTRHPPRSDSSTFSLSFCYIISLLWCYQLKSLITRCMQFNESSSVDGCYHKYIRTSTSCCLNAGIMIPPSNFSKPSSTLALEASIIVKFTSCLKNQNHKKTRITNWSQNTYFGSKWK